MADFSLDLNEDQLTIQKWVHDFSVVLLVGRDSRERAQARIVVETDVDLLRVTRRLLVCWQTADLDLRLTDLDPIADGEALRLCTLAVHARAVGGP